MATNTLYGLKRKSTRYISFGQGKILAAHGCDPLQDQIEISDQRAFDTPLFISVNGIPLFPSKYELSQTEPIIYSSNQPPSFSIKFSNDNFLLRRAKVKQNTISINDLKLYDRSNRKRTPSQNQVMGESAKVHVEKIIKQGILNSEINLSEVEWHWCHLVSFRMLPTHKAQSKRNLICATSACNGHMANIESAVKRFIYEFKRPLGLEVTATFFADTQVAELIRYRVYDKKGSLLAHSENFNALTHVKTDANDHFAIYERMKKMFCSDPYEGMQLISTIKI